MVNEGRRVRQRRVGMLIAASLVLAALSVSARAADATFAWYGEVIRVDETVATVRVGLADAALAAIGRAPGTRVALTWAPQGDLVVYAPQASDMASIAYGLLVDADLVSVDADTKSAVVKVSLPAEAAARAKSAAGSWVKVTAPVARSADRASVSLVAASRPAPRTAKVAGPAGGIDGSWTLTAVRKSGVSVGADCTLKNDAGRLTGTCMTARAESTAIELEGEVKGAAVTFRFLRPIQGETYMWKGELASSGTALKGTVQLKEETVEFTGSK